MKIINVLITGKQTLGFKIIEAFIRGMSGYVVKQYYPDAKEPFIWPDKLVNEFADIILVNLGDSGDEILNQISKYSFDNKVIIVFGPNNDMSLVRRSMKIGAKDYLSLPQDKDEILSLFNQYSSEILRNKFKRSKHQIISIIGSRGGVGSSFLSTNIAHICAEEKKLHTSLLDFDIQYGVQSMNLDIKTEHSLKDVVHTIFQLDSVALKGYFAKHPSGIFFLGESSNDMPIADDYGIENVEKLLEKCREIFDETVIDLTRHVDQVFSAVVEKSDRIVLVCQQSIVHIRDTKRIFDILVNEFMVSKKSIIIVVNRYNDKHTINVSRIQKTLGTDNIVPLANDYRRVSISLDSAVPMLEKSHNALLTKQISQLVKLLRDESGEEKSVIKRALRGIFK